MSRKNGSRTGLVFPMFATSVCEAFSACLKRARIGMVSVERTARGPTRKADREARARASRLLVRRLVRLPWYVHSTLESTTCTPCNLISTVCQTNSGSSTAHKPAGHSSTSNKSWRNRCEEDILSFLCAIDESLQELVPTFIDAGVLNKYCLRALAQ